MRGINKAQVMGRLGQDPVVSDTKNGKRSVSFSVATTEFSQNPQGEKLQYTEWHRIALFGKLADIAAQYLKKGSMVYIEGKIKTQRYTDKQGVERWNTNIVADNLIMLGGRSEAPQETNQSLAPSVTSSNHFNEQSLTAKENHSAATAQDFAGEYTHYSDDYIPNLPTDSEEIPAWLLDDSYDIQAEVEQQNTQDDESI